MNEPSNIEARGLRIDDGRQVCGGEEFEMVIDTASKLEETEMISHRGLIVVCRSWKKG